MSKHQQPTHSLFSKRPRLDTSPSDAANEDQVSVAPKSAPNDISKTLRDGPTQMELVNTLQMQTSAGFARNGSRILRGSSILNCVTLRSVMLADISPWAV